MYWVLGALFGEPLDRHTEGWELHCVSCLELGLRASIT